MLYYVFPVGEFIIYCKHEALILLQYKIPGDPSDPVSHTTETFFIAPGKDVMRHLEAVYAAQRRYAEVMMWTYSP